MIRRVLDRVEDSLSQLSTLEQAALIWFLAFQIVAILVGLWAIGRWLFA